MPVCRLHAPRRTRLHDTIVCILLVSVLVCPHTGSAAAPSGVAPQLSVDNPTATAGFYRLHWSGTAPVFELQEATGSGFDRPTTLYRGPDTATVISGKPDGTWYYRVRAATDAGSDAWSNALAVTVDHHDLGRALLFLALGFAVFIAIVVTVLRGKGRA
jgi:hypothetical protein